MATALIKKTLGTEIFAKNVIQYQEFQEDTS